jgi:hypothetical protein
MKRREGSGLSTLIKLLRTVSATVVGVAAGVVRALGRRRETMAELRPGDVAPDFTLTASDGRTYRLRDSTGKRAVVLAWFPKAFTGG